MSERVEDEPLDAPAPAPEPAARTRRWVFIGIAVVVLGLLGIGCLATLVVPGVVRNLHQAFRDKAEADVALIDQALNQYHLDRAGVWPESLDELVTPDAEGYTYLDRDTLPLDPWGNPYRYDPPGADGGGARVYSYGQDDRAGGEGLDADIANR